MLAVNLALGWRLAIYLVAGVAAGIANGVAGGGTFITFPTMLALSVPAVTANVSSTVGVLPSYLGGLRGFRAQLKTQHDLIRSLIPVCLAGTGIGCALLLLGSASQFRLIVPWLIGSATVLFALSPWITKRLANIEHDHPAKKWALQFGIFAVAVYGGYFGAGLGIMLLAIMALTLPDDIFTLQGLRSVLSTIINLVAAVIFLVRGHLETSAVIMIFIGAFLGGWLGTLLIKRLDPNVVRGLIVAMGVATTIKLAIS
jgi:uncharacterized membrane protein YfcA